jgi:hypothetical protein
MLNQNPADTLVGLQNKVFRLSKENKKLLKEKQLLLNLVAAAEAAAIAANAAYQELLATKVIAND